MSSPNDLQLIHLSSAFLSADPFPPEGGCDGGQPPRGQTRGSFLCVDYNCTLNDSGLLLSSPMLKSLPASVDSRTTTFFSGFPRERFYQSLLFLPCSPAASTHPAQSCSTLVQVGSFIERAVGCTSIWGQIWQAKPAVMRRQPCFSSAGAALGGWGLNDRVRLEQDEVLSSSPVLPILALPVFPGGIQALPVLAGGHGGLSGGLGE